MKITPWLLVAALVALAALAGTVAYAKKTQPWEKVSLQLEKLDEQGKAVAPALKHALPDLVAGMESDSRNSNYKFLWGESINYDEYAHGQIVRPSVLRAIAGFMGIEVKPKTDASGHEVVPAGMEHTYGYLFSTLSTPFGFKRARWVNGEIARGFGLPEDILGPSPKAGTLFQNVTFFAGRIAFREDPKEMAMLQEASKGVAQELREFQFDSLKPVRLEETVSVPERKPGVSRQVVLRTDLVPFTAGSVPGDKDTHLLVYSVMDLSRTGARLITAFPVASSFVAQVTDPSGLGEGKPVQTRYNGFVDGVTGARRTGTRKLVAPSAPGKGTR